MSAAAVALVGDPVAQSVSPQMHRAAFRAAGLDLDYVAVRLRRHELAQAFPSLRDRFLGLNVTRPLKEEVVALLDAISPEARRAGSVNTVVLGGRTTGHSTDGAGFLAALRRAGVELPGRAVVLGTGGAARAVGAALIDEGCAVTVWGRNGEAGRRLAGEVGATFAGGEAGALVGVLADSDLLVNATPVGSESSDAIPLPGPIGLRSDLTVFDLVYRPRRTALLREAEAAGCRTVEGVEMLIEQGGRSFELWTGREAPIAVMREAGYLALDRAGPEVEAASARREAR